MKVLVHGASLAGPPGRMAFAACALALRGHEVLWSGPGCPIAGTPSAGTLRRVPWGIGLRRLHADVVLGGGSPARAALAGWLVRAHCMVLDVRGLPARTWGTVDRGAWSTLHACGLLEEEDAAALRAEPGDLDLARFALWSADPAPSLPDAAHDDTEILERACERSLAAHRSRAPRAAMFVDRDGTLVVERGYLSDPAELELLPGTAAALRQVKAAGLPIVVVSNQSGVGRGLFPLSRVHEAMARLRILLRAEGVELDAIYFCPHRPEEGCACRKPGTGLLERAAEDQRLRLSACYMVGDKLLDVETAHRAGARGVLVRSGYGREEERLVEEDVARRPPDLVCEDLEAAALWILAQEDPADFA